MLEHVVGEGSRLHFSQPVDDFGAHLDMCLQRMDELYKHFRQSLREVLGEQFKSLSSLVDTKINDLIDSLVAEGGLLQRKDDNEDNSSMNCNFVDGKEYETEASTCDTEGQVRHRLYCYNARFYHVPESFEFPVDLKLDTGWKLWMGGQPNYKLRNNEDNTVKLAPIRPYRLLDVKMLPPKSASDRYRFL